MRLFYLIGVFSLMLAGCTGDGTAAKGSADTVDLNKFAHFELSKMPLIADTKDPENWCFSDFQEAVLISADPTNGNRKYFNLDEGVYKVAVNLGNPVASCMIRNTKGKAVELITSNQFPYCLANVANYKMNPEQTVVEYDSKKYIKFTLSVDDTNGYKRIGIEFAPSQMQFGLMVHRCTTCR